MTISSKMCTVGVAMCACCAGSSIASEVAISLDPTQANGWLYPFVNKNYGWEFTVAEPLAVTHLGVLDILAFDDSTPDGFFVAHDVGLYETTGALLRSATLDQGESGLLVDNFRYAPVPEFLLQPGVSYVVAAHYPAATFLPPDWVISRIPDFGTHPSVVYGAARHGFADSLALPLDEVDPASIHPYRFGPNFMVVPEPGTVVLIGLGAIAVLRRRSQA